MAKLHIEYIDTSALKEYAGNAKLHTDEQVEQIAKSIERFGFNDPIAVWKNNEIIEGHGRLLASRLLNIKKVPIIRLDKLSDEERRAYIIAHNQLTLNTTFDYDLLDIELEKIDSIDMGDFGIEFETEVVTGGYFGDERERTYSAYNLDEHDEADAVGEYDIPMLDPCSTVPSNLIGFNEVLTAKDFNAGVHFYIDDYQFERVWNQPYKYIDKLASFQCVLTPDFSLYSNMPMAMKIWNTYRSRQIGKILQREGLDVIPTVSWAEEKTFKFCFDGIPKHSTLSISTLGVKRYKEAVNAWCVGVDELLTRLEPERLLIYGVPIDHDFGTAEVIWYKNRTTERMAGR